jgi:HD-GYP domain-containing protein (c-di-GMP phosphodiesterase class II)
LFQAADERLYEAKQVGQQLIPYVRLEPDKSPKLGTSALWGSFGVLDALITAIDNRDHYTRAHSEQTMCYALLLANELGEPDEILDAVRISGLLYDVGKIAVPDAILRKPGFLSEDEKYIMQQHCRFGVMIMQDVAHREHVLEGVQSHHEAYDGSGYPDKLVGDGIPWMARLLAAADCFAAMTTDRPYRKSLSPAQALGELKKMRGKQFDPAMVDAFERVIAPVTSGEAELKDRLHDALVLCERLTAGERNALQRADSETANSAGLHPLLVPGASVSSAG